MPISYSETSMFIPETFDYDAYTETCQKQFGLTPDYDWALTYFGGYNIDKDFLGDSNTIFSNGKYDPWRAGGSTRTSLLMALALLSTSNLVLTILTCALQ